jgi:hypothetical protein
MKQIKLIGKGVNYIETWIDKEDLDKIGENNIDTEYFEDNLITGNQVICDFSGNKRIIKKTQRRRWLFNVAKLSKRPTPKQPSMIGKKNL